VFRTKLEEVPVLFDAPVAGHQLWVLRAMTGKGRDAWLTFVQKRSSTSEAGTITVNNFTDLNATMVAGVMYPATVQTKEDVNGTKGVRLDDAVASDIVECGLVPQGAAAPFWAHAIKGESNPPIEVINALPGSVLEELADKVRAMNGLRGAAAEKK